jgi:hypothetical protein
MDLEPDDEPWLGAPDALTGSWAGLRCEGGDDRGADDSKLEPSLGSLERVNQRSWSAGNGDDLEEQCGDEGWIEEDCPYNEDEHPLHRLYLG